MSSQDDEVRPDLERSATVPDVEDQRSIQQQEDDEKSERRSSQDSGDWPNNLVDWDGPDDPQNPRNWPVGKKIRATGLLSSITLGASFASSSFSPTFDAVAQEFGVSTEVTTLALSLYVLGLSFGPLMFAPISELFGRKISVLPPYFICGIFLIGVATAENLQTVMLCRFFAGLMASAPIANVAGGLADLWDDHDRALAVVGYSIAVIGGPTAGPLVGAAITNSYLGWRWTEYITSIIIFLILAINVFCLPETFAPVILSRKAKHLRYVTGNWALHTKFDEEELTGKAILEKHLARPLVMLATEPIILSLAIYNSFVYGLLYLLFEAFPIEYQENRGWTAVESSLVFLAVLVGVCISGIIQLSYQPIFWKKLDKAHEKGEKNDPEARLPPMVLGGLLFAVGLFWFGGSSGKDKSPAIGIVGAGCIGAGFVLIFQNAVNYLIDAFTVHAASAQAANTFLRSLAGAGFPLFATPMFKNLGVNWASYTLGFIGVALMPLPVLFYFFGPKLRAMSRYNPDKLQKVRTRQSEAKGPWQA